MSLIFIFSTDRPRLLKSKYQYLFSKVVRVGCDAASIKAFADSASPLFVKSLLSRSEFIDSPLIAELLTVSVFKSSFLL